MTVFAGVAHTAAISSRGELFTWGCGGDGMLGHGSSGSEWEPKRVLGLASSHIATLSFGSR